MKTSPSLSKRALALLRLLGLCGPLVFRQIQRVLPAFVPDLLERKTRARLLYRELQSLVKSRLVEARRPPSCNAAAYLVNERGTAALEASEGVQIDLNAARRYYARPGHELRVRDVLVEFVLLRSQAAPVVTELAWSLTQSFALGGDEADSKRAYEPDAVFWLTRNACIEQVVLVEVDRGTEPVVSVWRPKIAKARLVLDSLPTSSRLLVVTEGERRLGSLLEAAGDALGPALDGRLRGIVASELTAEGLLEPVFLCAGGTTRSLLDDRP